MDFALFRTQELPSLFGTVLVNKVRRCESLVRKLPWRICCEAEMIPYLVDLEVHNQVLHLAKAPKFCVFPRMRKINCIEDLYLVGPTLKTYFLAFTQTQRP